MKFVLKRTSSWNNYFAVNLHRKDEKLPDKNISKRWKVTEEVIEVYLEHHKKSSSMYSVHMIEINSLEELMEFQQEVGSIIIEKFWLNAKYFSLEIYDDFRE